MKKNTYINEKNRMEKKQNAIGSADFCVTRKNFKKVNVAS